MFPTTVRNDRRRSVVSRGFDGSVRVSGLAALAQRLTTKRRSISDANAIAKVASDHLRQLDLQQPALGLWERTEGLKMGSSSTSLPSFRQEARQGHPSAPSPDSDSGSEWEALADSFGATSSHTNTPNTDSDSPASDDFAPMPRLGGAPMQGETPPRPSQEEAQMAPMPRATGQKPVVPYSSVKRQRQSTTHSIPPTVLDTSGKGGSEHHPFLLATPTSIVTIQKNALAFVAKERQTQAHQIASAELRYAAMHEYANICDEEAEARCRMQQAFVELSEQIVRFAIHAAYDKFVVFSVQKEPVWRKAARQLQARNEERFNSTENMYARFALAETAYAEKQRMAQEAADYVVSLRVLYDDEMIEATQRARDRRRSSVHTSAVAGPTTAGRTDGTAMASYRHTRRRPVLRATEEAGSQRGGAPATAAVAGNASGRANTNAPVRTTAASRNRTSPTGHQSSRPQGGEAARNPTAASTASAPGGTNHVRTRARAPVPLTATEAVPQRQYGENRNAWSYVEVVGPPAPAANPTRRGGNSNSNSNGNAHPAANPRPTPRQVVSVSSARRAAGEEAPVVGVLAPEPSDAPHAFSGPVFGEVVHNPVPPVAQRRPTNAPARAHRAAAVSGDSVFGGALSPRAAPRDRAAVMEVAHRALRANGQAAATAAAASRDKAGTVTAARRR